MSSAFCTWIKSGCLVVHETAKTADSILSQVKTASMSMSQSAVAATASFLDYLDRDGQALRQSTGEHFNFIERQSERQTRCAGDVKALSDGFGSHNQTCVTAPDGSLPQREEYPPLPADRYPTVHYSMYTAWTSVVDM